MEGPIDHKVRAQDMHRRAQLAEARLERARWWIEAGMEWCRNEAKRTNCWPTRMPRFYIDEAKAAIDRGRTPTPSKEHGDE